MAVVKAYNEAPSNMKASILKDCVIIHLHSVVPPDRVGVYAATPTARSLALRIPKCMPWQVIRKLRWNLSLKREGSDLVIDTSEQRHKSELAALSTLANATADCLPSLSRQHPSSMVSRAPRNGRATRRLTVAASCRPEQDDRQQDRSAVAGAVSQVDAVGLPSPQSAVPVECRRRH